MKGSHILLLLVLLMVVFSGVVNMSMLLISSDGHHGFTNDTDDLMSRYDYDHDGFMDFEGYKAMWFDASHGTITDVNDLEEDFNMRDTDMNGYIESEELSFTGVVDLNNVYDNTK